MYSPCLASFPTTPCLRIYDSIKVLVVCRHTSGGCPLFFNSLTPSANKVCECPTSPPPFLPCSALHL